MVTDGKCDGFVFTAETRKEEIVRFSKAKADPEFAKMLKVGTLDRACGDAARDSAAEASPGQSKGPILNAIAT